MPPVPPENANALGMLAYTPPDWLIAKNRLPCSSDAGNAMTPQVRSPVPSDADADEPNARVR